MKIFRVGSQQFRESLRELLRELWFSYCSSRERPFREWNFAFQKSVSEFRELLREYPRTLRELRERHSHSESVFPEIGVVPRLLNFTHKTFHAQSCRHSSNLQVKQTNIFSHRSSATRGDQFFIWVGGFFLGGFLGFGNRGLLEKGSFRKVHFLEILDNLRFYRTSRKRKTKEIPTNSRDSREFRDFRVKTFISCYRTPGPQKGFRRGF